MLVKLLVPAAVAAGLCVPGAFREGGHGHLPGAFLEAKLNISADQKTAMREVLKRHKPALAARMAALVQARNAALDAGMDPSVTQDAWRADQEKVAEAMQEVAKEVRGAYLEALPILTEAQKAEGKALLKKAHQHMGGMHGRHHTFALGFVKGRLELTETQTIGIQTVLENHKGALEERREALHEAMSAVVEAAMDPATPQATLDQRNGVAKQAGIALAAEVRAAYLEIVPQLTPEQQNSAKGLLVDFRNVVDSVRKLALGF